MTKEELKTMVREAGADNSLTDMVCDYIDTAWEAAYIEGFRAGQTSIMRPLEVVIRIMSGEKVVGHCKA